MRIKDALATVMGEVQAEYSAGETPYYLPGRPQHIANLLSEKTKSSTWKYKKYPLVMLIQDFTEQRGGLFESIATVTIVIVSQADPKNRKLDRDDENYDNILYPIYDILIEKLKETTLFDMSEGYEHTLIESYYYGSPGAYGNTGNIMNDTLDALILENLELRLIKQC